MSARRLSVAERLFRASLLLYPRHLREVDGAEMLHLFGELQRDAAAQGQGGRFLFDTFRDALTGPWRARRASPHPRPKTPRQEASLMTTLRHDLAVAFRRLAKQPGFTAIAILTLALGIGANTAIFSVVYGVLLRPLGLPESEKLAIVSLHRTDLPSDSMGFWPAHLEILRQHTEGRAGLEGLTSYIFDSVTLTGDGQAEEIGTTLMVDGHFFETLGARPVLGRTFGPGDVVPNQVGSVAVLGEAYWRQRFGGDRQILGKALELDGRSVTVVGVVSDSLPLPQAGVQLWLPRGWDPEDRSLSGRISLIARLDAEDSFQATTDLLSGAVVALRERSPFLSEYTISLRGFRDNLVGSARPVILAAAGGVGLILLVACANMASLLLARAATREQEMATRRALGAHRRQVTSQLLCESLVLALGGGLAGLALALGMHRMLLALASGLLPRLADVRLDLPVLGFAALASIATGLLFGLAPVVYTFTRDLASAMRGGAATRSRGLTHARAGLAVAQVALAVMLTVGAALMLRSLSALASVDPGFESEGVGGSRIYLDGFAYPESAQKALYFEQLRTALEARPDIEIAGASTGLPMDPLTIDYDLPYQLPGEAPSDDPQHQAYFRTITPGYLETVGIPLLRGRLFDSRDHAEGEQVAIINETFANLAWPDVDAVGESFSIYGGSRTLRVVGIVGDVRFAGPDDEDRAEFFVPHPQVSYGAMTMVARSRDGDIAATAIAEEALRLDPRQPVHSSFSLAGLERGAVASPRFFTLLLVTFASVALLLAAAGIYGVLAGWVADSSRELGVRLALGADTGDIVGLVFRRSVITAVFGLALGLVGSKLTAGVILPFLFGVDASDVVSLAAVVGVMVAVTVLASLVPALRAAHLEPTHVLRLE